MKAPSVVITGVNVIPMDTDDVIADCTVSVAGERIVNVSPGDETPIQSGTRVIDGQGGFLMPGLCDMHTHLRRRDPDPGHLILYLAEGVTTVRAMSGPEENHQWRLAVETGNLVGPTILTAGLVLIGGLDGVPQEVIDAEPVFIPSTPEEAAEEVNRQAKSWPDFVKVYDGLDRDTYLSAIAAANQAGIYVAGHALDELSAVELLTSGIDEIAHIDELSTSHWIGEPGEPGFDLDYAGIQSAATLMRENDVAVVSNLVADEVLYELILDQTAVLSRPEYRVVRPHLLEHWRTEGRHLNRFADQGPHRRDVEMPFLKALLRALQSEGVMITVGTDTAPDLEGSLPSNIHRDIELLVESGFSAIDALRAATLNAGTVAERMGLGLDFGKVQPGCRADLLLLAENPLEDVAKTRDRLGVMTRGRWFDQTELDRMSDELIASYSEVAS